MAKWNTEKILEDLNKLIPEIKKMENLGQPGACETDVICIKFNDTKEKLWMCGLYHDRTPVTEPENVDVPLIALSDGLKSQGGLNSKNYNLAKHYIDIRQYFIKKKFDVVNSIQSLDNSPKD